MTITRKIKLGKIRKFNILFVSAHYNYNTLQFFFGNFFSFSIEKKFEQKKKFSKFFFGFFSGRLGSHQNIYFFRFLFFELWSFLYSYHPNFHDNSKKKNLKINFSFISAHSASAIKTGSKVQGRVCISLVRKKSRLDNAPSRRFNS